MLALPPLSLYVHLPWCVRKCPYCDFNSHEGRVEEQAYLERLKYDLEQDLHWVQGRKLSSIFFGGGTPSLLSDAFYGQLLPHLAERIGFEPDIEITLEANPGTLDEQYFRGYRTAGINRLSLGIQSFNGQHLHALGRVHDPEQAKRAIDTTIKLGFRRFNLDLMFGLPQQSLEQGLADLECALSFDPEHLSWYQLTLEPNTQFYRQPPSLPDDDAIFELFEAGQQLLAKQGLEQYEISAYAKAGAASRHNLNYWRFGDYLGLGAGAHGKISRPDGSLWRTQKTRLPKDYLNPERLTLGQTQVIAEDLDFEFLLNALRLKQGVPWQLYQERTGQDPNALANKLAPMVAKGLITLEPLALTEQGYLFYNSVLASILD